MFIIVPNIHDECTLYTYLQLELNPILKKQQFHDPFVPMIALLVFSQTELFITEVKPERWALPTL